MIRYLSLSGVLATLAVADAQDSAAPKDQKGEIKL
jgi:hypothetical protein